MLVTKIMINTINIIINYAMRLEEFYEGGTRSLHLSDLLIRLMFAPDEVSYVFINCMC